MIQTENQYLTRPGTKFNLDCLTIFWIVTSRDGSRVLRFVGARRMGHTKSYLCMAAGSAAENFGVFLL